MIESIPSVVDSALLYFHTRRSSGDEMAPFVDELRLELPNTYLWAGDGCIEGQWDDPVMGRATRYGTSKERYWFVFPTQGSGAADFTFTVEAMGAVLVTSGGYANALVDHVMARFRLPAARVVLCGHQHGACVALAAAMMRREDPYSLALLFDPWPLETLYLQREHDLPRTKVMCIDNLWVRERERQRGAVRPLFQGFQQYGMNAEGVTLDEGAGEPDGLMFREAARQLRKILG